VNIIVKWTVNKVFQTDRCLFILAMIIMWTREQKGIEFVYISIWLASDACTVNHKWFVIYSCLLLYTLHLSTNYLTDYFSCELCSFVNITWLVWSVSLTNFANYNCDQRVCFEHTYGLLSAIQLWILMTYTYII
jgi:hypothetical protein